MHQAGHTSLAQAISTSCMQGIRPAAESARKLTLRKTDSGAAKHHAHVRGLGHEVTPPLQRRRSHANTQATRHPRHAPALASQHDDRVAPAVEHDGQTASHDATHQATHALLTSTLGANSRHSIHPAAETQ